MYFNKTTQKLNVNIFTNNFSKHILLFYSIFCSIYCTRKSEKSDLVTSQRKQERIGSRSAAIWAANRQQAAGCKLQILKEHARAVVGSPAAEAFKRRAKSSLKNMLYSNRHLCKACVMQEINYMISRIPYGFTVYE